MDYEEVVYKIKSEKDNFVRAVLKDFCNVKKLKINKLRKKKKRFSVKINPDKTEEYYYKKTLLFILKAEINEGNDKAMNIVYNYEKTF